MSREGTAAAIGHPRGGAGEPAVAAAPGLELRVEQRQVPIPVLMQLFRMLPASTTDVGATVERALEQNPMLVRGPGSSCPRCGRHLRGRRCPTCAAFGPRSGQVEPVVARRNWRDELVDAVALERDAPDRAAIEAVVHQLDGHGLLGEDDDEDALARRLGIPGTVVARAVAAIRSAGPPGIASRSPLDCVRRQCRSIVARGDAEPVLVEIAERHLELVAAEDLDQLARVTGHTVAEVSDAVATLRRSTRPYATVDEQAVAYVQPDVIIRHDGSGGFVVEVADAAWFGVRVAPAPASAAAWADPLVREASVLLAQVEVRASLLRRIGAVLLARQRGYLLAGPAAHRPLRRAEVAELLGVHPSTVGRAVKDKWLQVPDGHLVPLGSCFGAAQGPMEHLRRLLRERPGASDGELARLLADEGVTLARRTVAKYRATLGEARRHPKPPSGPGRAS